MQQEGCENKERKLERKKGEGDGTMIRNKKFTLNGIKQKVYRKNLLFIELYRKKGTSYGSKEMDGV